MRLGLLTRGEAPEFDRVRTLGLRAVEWVAFEDSPVATAPDWRGPAEEVAGWAQSRGLLISAIGALYRNPLDPPQTEHARRLFTRAIEVAAHIGVRTVAGFPGAVVEVQTHERGGNPVYLPFENYIPQLVEFWEPLARFAADHNVRIAFEHCPQGPYHLPVMHYNMLAQPAMWERLFNATPLGNLGIEWDASHLICQFIDPVQNIQHFGPRIFHVHAKDAWIDRPLLEKYGICHPGVAEHRFPGLGQANWPQIVHSLLRAGYDSDLNIEGWHDPVFRDHPENDTGARAPALPTLRGRQLEDAGIRIARATLEPLISGTE